MAGGTAAAGAGVVHNLLEGVGFPHFGGLEDFLFGHSQAVTDDASGGRQHDRHSGMISQKATAGNVRGQQGMKTRQRY